MDDSLTTLLICTAIASLLYLVQATRWSPASFRAGIPVARFTSDFPSLVIESHHLAPADGQTVIFRATTTGSWLFRRQFRGPHVVPWLTRAPYLVILAEAKVTAGRAYVIARLPLSLAAALLTIVLIPWFTVTSRGTSMYTARQAMAGSAAIFLILSLWVRAEVRRIPILYGEMIKIVVASPEATADNSGAA